MKNIELGSVKHLILLIITTSIFGVILYPLFDLIICKFFSNTKFTYSINGHIIQPIVFGIIFGLVYWAFIKNKTTKNSKIK